MRMYKYILSLMILVMLCTAGFTQSGGFQTPDKYWEIAAGRVPGYSAIFLHGRNGDVDTGTDPEDIWGYGGTITYFTTPQTLYISSSSANDTEDITISYLDRTWNAQTVTTTLQGQTRVNTGVIAIRVNGLINNDANALVGTVYCYSFSSLTAGVPNTTTTIQSTIEPGFEKSMQTHYAVPLDHTAYIIHGWGSNNNDAGWAKLYLARRPFGGQFQVYPFFGCNNTGGGNFQIQSAIPFPIVARSDIKMVCHTVETDNTDVSGGYMLILEDNTP